MPEIDDAQLDALVRRHVSDQLDGQLGRAGDAFLRHLSASPGAATAAATAPAGAAPRVASPVRPFMRLGGRLVTLAGTALAACVAGLLAAPTLLQNVPAGPGPGPSSGGPVAHQDPNSAGPRLAPTYQFVHSRTVDEGTVTIGGEDGPIPVRRIRRDTLERVYWYDAEQGAQVELLVPRRDLGFMEVDTY